MTFSSSSLYFFDQPTKPTRIKGARSNILRFNLAQEEAQLEDTTQRDENIESGARSQRLSGGSCEPDPSPKDHGDMDAYRRAAPHLLTDLARLLSRHKWAELRVRLPHGILNILSLTWKDLTAAAAAAHLKGPEQKDKKCVKEEEARSRQVSRNSGVVVVDSVRNPQSSSNPRVKKRKAQSNRAHSTASFSISSSSCSNPGWILQRTQSSCDAPQQISLCQWVVRRLKVARNPEKLQTADQDTSKPLILRHYGDAKANLKDKRAKRKARPSTLVDWMPQIPELKQPDPAQQKLHYRLHDGSSFIYYPSGRIAVCHSHSGLPCGGFYTNVFSDSERPVILATVTAFGHGAVTHPVSSVITAVWDQVGGFMCGHHGNITKEWSWQTNCTPREKIVIQVSDVISVRLLSGTSAMLSFRCNNESVQLPLSALANINQPKEMTCLQSEGKFTCDSAQDLLLTRKTKSPALVLEGKRDLILTPVSVCSRDVLQMVREVDGPEEPSAQWRRGGRADRELRRLQQRVRSTLDRWLEFYRVAVGIKCPDRQRMPDAPLRTRLRRAVQSAALPSLNPPERADAGPVRPEEGRKELQKLHTHLSAERPLDSDVKLSSFDQDQDTKKAASTQKKRPKEKLCVTQIGPLQIHGDFPLESVIIPNSADLQPSTVPPCPAPLPSFSPSAPVTACPALLRAALQREGGRRRCCCSAALMPVVTDLEYDAFVMGQPPHSHQILVVCVTPPLQHVDTHAASDQGVLEQLYRKRNRHRTMPCTQCQMDSFRLVRYEMPTGKPGSCGEENILLLQQRHNAAPGMVLMYIRGKLLFVGYIFSDHSCSVRDLQKQISRARGDYRLGLSLPSDYKFSDTVNSPAATDTHNSQDAALKGRNDTTLTAAVETEKVNKRKHNQAPEVSHQQQRDFHVKPKKTPALPRVPVITH